MSNEGRDTAVAFLAGALAGALAGGVAVLLLAPERGSETRRRLREGARDLYQRGDEALGTAKETVGEKAREVAESTRVRVDQLSETTRTQVGAVRGAVAEGREAYRREIARKEGE